MLRKHLLPHPAFPVDEYAQIGGGYLYGHVKRVIEFRRVSNDAESVFDGLKIHGRQIS